MVVTNPILDWDERNLGVMIDGSRQKAAYYETLSKASHLFLVFFGFNCLMAFGMTNPSYTAITGTLIITGYGPACDHTVEAFKAMADNARVQCGKYETIRQNLQAEELADVPELNDNAILIAQWHALSPLEIPENAPPDMLRNPDEGEAAYQQFADTFEIRIENCRRKLIRAYLIHVGNHNDESRTFSEIEEFHEYSMNQLVPNIPFAIYGNTLFSEVEEASPAGLAEWVFSQA